MESKNSYGKYDKIPSVAQTILAILWRIKTGSLENIVNHKYFQVFCKNKSKSTCRSTIWRLYNKQLIGRARDVNDIDIFNLSLNSGKIALNAFIKTEISLHGKENQHWDGGWRMIFFDIPESKRKNRDNLRNILKMVGFKEFQKSVWIYPYPVPSFLKNLFLNEEVKSHVKFITTGSIQDDAEFKKQFKLYLLDGSPR